MPTARYGQFAINTARARDLIGLGQSVGSMTHGRVDASDIYRAGVVQAVGALDAYVHGIVLDRAVDILVGRLTTPSSSTKIGLHFNAVQQLLATSSPADTELTARTHIAQRLALETFQRPDDIASAFAMVGISKVWSSAFNASAGKVKTALGLVVDRRNRIVHSCDIDPLNPGRVTPLSDKDALDAITTVEKMIAAIDVLC
jgi:hypothetical protein